MHISSTFLSCYKSHTINHLANTQDLNSGSFSELPILQEAFQASPNAQLPDSAITLNSAAKAQPLPTSPHLKLSDPLSIGCFQKVAEGWTSTNYSRFKGT